MTYTRLNPGVHFETIRTNYSQAISANSGKDFAIDISALNAAYEHVTISGCIEVNAFGYAGLAFITSWVDGNNAWFAFRNATNASITMNWLRVTFICYGER